MEIDKLFQTALKTAVNAGNEVLKIYNNKEYNIQNKENNTPITDADLKSNNIIIKQLSSTNIPILSEEGDEKEWNIIRGEKYYWLIDPLDGTKEFINRNGEFTVNIALMENNSPIMGVIYTPVLNLLFGGVVNKGAWQWSNFEKESINIESGKKLPLKNNKDNFIILGSKSFRNPQTDELIEKIKSKNKFVELKRVGSSLKFCHIASGQADIYPRLDNIMQWDVAAGIAILLASGGGIINMTNQESKLFQNQDLIFEKFIAWNKDVDINLYINKKEH